MERRRIVVVILAALLAQSAAAAKTKVQLITRADDQFGRDFAFEVKEAFRRSSIYDFSDSASGTTMTLLIQTTMAVAGSMVAFSLTYTMDNIYITSTVGTCGIRVFASCAKSIVAGTDTAMSILSDSLEEQSKRSK